MEAIVVTDGQLPEPPKSFRNRLRLRTFTMPFRGFRPATSRNIGIHQARGDVILSLDFDMIFHPRTVEEHLKVLHQQNHAATIGHRRFIDATSVSVRSVLKNPGLLCRLPRIRSVSNTIGGFHDKRLAEFAFFKKHKYPFNCFHGCNISYFKDDAIDVGKWNSEFDGIFGYEDIEFGYRLWENNIKLVYCEPAFGYHQENQVVSKRRKASERHHNLAKLYRIMPKLREYRRKLDNSEKKGFVG